MSEAKQLRYWQAYITAHSEKYNRVVNQTVGVVARDMGEVIQLVVRDYPDAEFWTIQHRGKVNVSLVKYDNETHFENEAVIRHQEI